MKLATYRDGSRDGQLVVVSRDLSLAHYATGIASRLQDVLDDWNFAAPLLQDLSETLNHGKARHAFSFDAALCAAPLPRVHGASLTDAWPAHQAWLARAAGQTPAAGPGAPELLPGDVLLGPNDDVALPGGSMLLDFGAAVGVVLADVPAAASPDQALEAVRLCALGCAWRAWPQAADAGVPDWQARAPFMPMSLAPVLVSVDELGAGWQRGRWQARLKVQVNGQDSARLDIGEGLRWHHGQMAALLARWRPLWGAHLLMAGPVSAAAPESGSASWVQARAMHALRELPPGKGRQALQVPAQALQPGDVVRLELVDPEGASLCGALEHTIIPA